MNFLGSKSLACLAAASLSLFAGGCARHTINTASPAAPTYQKEMVNDARVLNNPKLSVRARIVGFNQATTAGGALRVQAELENTKRSATRFYYMFEWFDQNGMQVNTPATGALIPIGLEGKESKFISSVAPTLACKDFRLKLMPID